MTNGSDLICFEEKHYGNLMDRFKETHKAEWLKACDIAGNTGEDAEEILKENHSQKWNDFVNIEYSEQHWCEGE